MSYTDFYSILDVTRRGLLLGSKFLQEFVKYICSLKLNSDDSFLKNISLFSAEKPKLQMESGSITGIQVVPEQEKLKNRLKRALLVLNCMMLGLGNCGGPLVSRLYFVKGGKRIWLSSWLLTGGWPLLILPLSITYFLRRSKQGPQTKLYGMNLGLFFRCAFIGILTGVDDYLSAYGSSRLPVSTSALIIATQLAFTAGFAYLLVKQKFTHFIINAIFLLSLGAVILGFHSSTDRPAHESNLQYYIGFFMTLGTSALYGFVLPLMEFTCRKYKHIMTYSLVMEMQIVISIFATGFCTIGMLFNHDFQVEFIFLMKSKFFFSFFFFF